MVAKDRIMAEGYDDYHLGKDLSDNPYDEFLMHPQHELWEDGWLNAHDERWGYELLGTDDDCL